LIEKRSEIRSSSLEEEKSVALKSISLQLNKSIPLFPFATAKSLSYHRINLEKHTGIGVGNKVVVLRLNLNGNGIWLVGRWNRRRRE
jgi:hypothetical protein